MALQVTRGVLCKVTVREELEILRQARLDAQRIVNRLGLLYGVPHADGPEWGAIVMANTMRNALVRLSDGAQGAVDDEAVAAADDLFARMARREMEVGE